MTFLHTVRNILVNHIDIQEKGPIRSIALDLHHSFSVTTAINFIQVLRDKTDSFLNCKKEDLDWRSCFLEGRRRNGHVGHVGIVTEINPNNFKFIHSSTTSGVIISSSTEPYYSSNICEE